MGFEEKEIKKVIAREKALLALSGVGCVALWGAAGALLPVVPLASVVCGAGYAAVLTYKDYKKAKDKIRAINEKCAKALEKPSTETRYLQMLVKGCIPSASPEMISKIVVESDPLKQYEDNAIVTDKGYVSFHDRYLKNKSFAARVFVVGHEFGHWMAGLEKPQRGIAYARAFASRFMAMQFLGVAVASGATAFGALSAAYFVRHLINGPLNNFVSEKKKAAFTKALFVGTAASLCVPELAVVSYAWLATKGASAAHYLLSAKLAQRGEKTADVIGVLLTKNPEGAVDNLRGDIASGRCSLRYNAAVRKERRETRDLIASASPCFRPVFQLLTAVNNASLWVQGALQTHPYPESRIRNIEKVGKRLEQHQRLIPLKAPQNG